MKKLNIGILANKNIPSYKRRLLHLLKNNSNNIVIEYNKTDFFDILIVDSFTYNLSIKNYNKLIFELPDNLLTSPYSWYKFPFNYIYKYKKNKDLTHFLEKVDYIIVGSKMQSDYYRLINKNSTYIVDPIDDTVLIKNECKNTSDTINVGIEFGALNIFSIINNKEFIKAINNVNNLKIHIMTDNIVLPYIYKTQNVYKSLYEIFGNKLEFYNWEKNNYDKFFNSIDIGLIPIDTESEFSLSKPQNRALIMLANKKPVICSLTKDNIDNLSKFKTVYYAKTSDDWIENIKLLRDNEYALLESLHDSNKVKTIHSVQNFINFHNKVFEKIANV